MRRGTRSGSCDVVRAELAVVVAEREEWRSGIELHRVHVVQYKYIWAAILCIIRSIPSLRATLQ